MGPKAPLIFIRTFLFATTLSLASAFRNVQQPLKLSVNTSLAAQKKGSQRNSTLHLIAKASRAREVEDPEDSHKKKMEGIKEKWEGMGQVMEIMFVIACRAKHKADVHGLAAHKMRQEDLSLDDFNALKKDIQAKNLEELTEACGTIVNKGLLQCRSGCATHFNAKMELRNECDGKCVEAYKTFESGCLSRQKDLEEIYEAEMKKQMAMQKCFTEFCEQFPTVTTLAEDKQKEEVDKRCEDYCDPDKVSMRCEEKVRFDSGFWGGAIKDDCWAKEDLPGCLDKKKGDLDADSMKPEEYKKELDKAKAACEKKSQKSFAKCEKKEFKKREEDAQKECEEESAPKCDKDCHKMCEVDRMNACIGKLNTELGDATQDYCEEMWTFIQESSDLDPMGMPIVPK